MCICGHSSPSMSHPVQIETAPQLSLVDESGVEVPIPQVPEETPVRPPKKELFEAFLKKVEAARQACGGEVDSEKKMLLVIPLFMEILSGTGELMDPFMQFMGMDKKFVVPSPP